MVLRYDLPDLVSIKGCNVLGKKSALNGKDPLWIIVAGLLLSGYMRFLYYSSRKRFINPHFLTQTFADDQPAIIAAWHNRNVLSPFAFISQSPKHCRLSPIASASKDGGLAAWAMWGLGLSCVRGSSSRGGAGALKQMIRLIRAGRHVAFTPDGPRGPLHHVHQGVLIAAKMTGAPIVPLTYHAKRHKRLKSWDRLMIPKPFTRLNFVYGEPLFVPRKATAEDLEEMALTLRQRLLKCDEEAAQF